jgi:murein DD-endopeptidase MepM/ murein hydrolase activator NlpD
VSTIQKLNKNSSQTERQNLNKSLRKVIFSFIWGQRKWLASLAVIFLVAFSLDLYGLPFTKEENFKPHLFGEEVGEIVSAQPQDAQAQDQTILGSNGNGVLGGPMVFGSLVAPVAQAQIDFSADDQYEDYDMVVVENNSIISSANPSGTAMFSGFRIEILKYVVKQGDNPEKIAISFDINTDTLLSANGLNDNSIIKPGQELTILPINGVRVQVGKKDTLDSIAKKYKGDKMEIIAFNNLTLDEKINVGDWLIIPDGEMPPAPKAAPRYTTPTNKYANSTIPAGWLIIPTVGHDWGKIHASNGVDIAAACGTPVYAAAAGTVILSDGVGYNGGYGKYIKIQHPNGVVTLYGHSSKLLVDAGEKVGQGQLIMLMGTTGRSTGCHLHFEVRGASNPLAGKARNY